MAGGAGDKGTPGMRTPGTRGRQQVRPRPGLSKWLFCSRGAALLSEPLVSANGSYCVLIPPPQMGEEISELFTLH